MFRRTNFSWTVAAAIAAVAFPSVPANAKPVEFTVQPSGVQQVAMEQGRQRVTSTLPGSSLIFKTPEPIDGGRVRFLFGFINRSAQATDVGPEDIFSTPINVVPYEQLISEQRSSETASTIIAALGSFSRSMAANRQSNYRYSTENYTSYVDCGIMCGGTVSGVRQVRTFDPELRRQAQAAAEEQNSQSFAQIRAESALQQSVIDENLRTTTVAPGGYILGFITFSIPKSIRKAKFTQPFVVQVRIGADLHVLQGFVGPMGASAPPAVKAAEVQPAAFKPASVARAAVVSPVQACGRLGYQVGTSAYTRCKQDIATGFAVPRASFSASDGVRVGVRAPPAAKASEVQPDPYTGAIKVSSGRLSPVEACGKLGFQVGTSAYSRCKQDFATGFTVPTASYAAGSVTGASKVTSPDTRTANEFFNLGWMYDHGKGVPQDSAKAVNFYRKAAEQGLSAAQFNLGVMYYQGTGIALDYIAAMSWFEKAAEQGDVTAQYNLANMYYNSKGVAQDFAQAILWYSKAAEQGYLRAQSDLGHLYTDGRYIGRDYALAAKWSRKAAEQGDAKAQYNIAWMYNNGKGVEQDHAAALLWYQNAAEQGHAMAQSNLGQMYASGTGVAQDYGVAVGWYRKAAEQGVPVAQYNLGLMYGSGMGVVLDAVEAYKWLSLSQVGYTDPKDRAAAIKQRELVASKMEPDQIAEAIRQASAWRKR